jgi:hypothetical protein
MKCNVKTRKENPDMRFPAPSVTDRRTKMDAKFQSAEILDLCQVRRQACWLHESPEIEYATN